jgi:glutathione S-transferase
MALTLYTNPMSRGRIVRWLLEEAGVPYDTVLLDYSPEGVGSMKSEDFRAINPMGKVPAIVHEGRIVTEGAAICAYVAEAFPAAGLAPTEEERAEYYRWLFFAAGPLEQAITNQSMGFVPSAEQGRMAGYGSFDLAIDVLEQAVSRHDYIAGDRFTAADVYVGSQVGWGLQFGSIPTRAAFADYWARLETRAAYKRATAIDDALLAPST